MIGASWGLSSWERALLLSQLRAVTVMRGDTLSYADTFEEAMAGIVGTDTTGEP